jgi:pantothenate kinase
MRKRFQSSARLDLKEVDVIPTLNKDGVSQSVITSSFVTVFDKKLIFAFETYKYLNIFKSLVTMIVTIVWYCLSFLVWEVILLNAYFLIVNLYY